jgi:hypothetical protein
MAQVVSRRPLTAETRVRVRVNPCGICGGQSGTGTGFSPSSSVFPCQYIIPPCNGVDWIHLAHDKVQSQALVNLTCWVTISFSGRTKTMGFNHGFCGGTPFRKFFLGRMKAGTVFRNFFFLTSIDLKLTRPPWAVPLLRSLVAGLSPRRPGFVPGSIHAGFVMEKVALGQGFLRVLRFSPVNIPFHRRSPNSYHLGNA